MNTESNKQMDTKNTETQETKSADTNVFAETMKEGFDKVFSNLKTAVVALVAATAIIVGCTTIPSVESIEKTATAVGYATGMVANMTKISDVARNTIVDIVNEVKVCVPETNQTFEVAWTPIAQAHTDKLVADGKIDAKEGEIIMCAFKTVTKGIDYLFDVRYPKARQYKDLTAAAIHGFSNGFLTVFKPVNGSLSATNVDYDKEAYEYLTK